MTVSELHERSFRRGGLSEVLLSLIISLMWWKVIGTAVLSPSFSPLEDLTITNQLPLTLPSVFSLGSCK